MSGKEKGFIVGADVREFDQLKTAADVEAAIKPTTILVSVMLGNNEIGTINARISEGGRELGTVTSQIEAQVNAAVTALAGPERTIPVTELEVAVLARGNGRRTFQRIEDDELTPLIEPS